MTHYYVLTDSRGYAIVEDDIISGYIYTKKVDRGVLFQYLSGFIEISLNGQPSLPVVHLDLQDEKKKSGKTHFPHNGELVDYYPILNKLFKYETAVYDIFNFVKSHVNYIFEQDSIRLLCAGKIFMIRTNKKPLVDLYIDEENMTISCGNNNDKICLSEAVEISLASVEEMFIQKSSILSWLLLIRCEKLNVIYGKI